MSLPSPSRALVADPLVAQTAKKIAHVINDFKRELAKRDGTWAHAHGEFELAFESQSFVFTLVPDKDGEAYPVTVRTRLKSPDSTNNSVPLLSTNGSPAYKSMRLESDIELEGEPISRKKQKLDEKDDPSNKRQRPDDEEENVVPLILKEDLDDLLSKLRGDIQENTSECVNHVQWLLKKCKKDMHEESKLDYQQSQIPRIRPLSRDSIPNGTTPGASFPSPSVDRDDQTVSVPDIVRREAKLISTHCRRYTR